LCKTLDSSQALKEAEEREEEASVNEQEMAERLACACNIEYIRCRFMGVVLQ